jgi:hypothetical protein
MACEVRSGSAALSVSHRGPGRPHSPTRLEIALAVPPGSRRARGQRGWLRAVLADPVIASLRADRRRVVLELARVLARHADWHLMTTWRPRTLACEEIGSSRDPSRPLSVSAYKAARRVLEDCGYLGLACPAWVPFLRAGAPEPGGLSPVFVLAIPRRKPRLCGLGRVHPVNRPVARFGEPGEKPLARETAHERGKADAASRRRRPLRYPAEPWPILLPPENRDEEERAAEVVRTRCPPLRGLSSRHVRHLLHPWFRARYCVDDVLFAVDHSPGGRGHGYLQEVRHPPGWLRARLALWLSPDGVPVPSRSQRRAAVRAQVLAGQLARRQARQEAAQRRADPPEAWRVARAADPRLRGPARPPPAGAFGAA